MTAAALLPLIGRTAYWSTGRGASVEVFIVDAVERWGRTRYKIRPVAGIGTMWVETLTIPETPGGKDAPCKG